MFFSSVLSLHLWNALSMTRYEETCQKDAHISNHGAHAMGRESQDEDEGTPWRESSEANDKAT